MKRFYVFWYAAIVAAYLSTGCSKNTGADGALDSGSGLTLNAKSHTGHFDDEPFAFVANGADAEDITWTSSDEFVGTVDENGVFTPHHIGETIITAKAGNSTVTSNVTIQAQVPAGTFLEPLIDFTADRARIQDFERNTGRSVLFNTTNRITYLGSNSRPREYGVSYEFENNLFVGAGYGLRTGPRVGQTNPVQAAQVRQYYRERYRLLETTATREVFVYSEATATQPQVVIVLQHDRTGREVVNIPFMPFLASDIYVAIYLSREDYDNPPPGVLLPE